MSAVELIRHLQLEADELRKQKKRQNVTGLHKSVQLVTLLHSVSSAGESVLKHPHLFASGRKALVKNAHELVFKIKDNLLKQHQ